MLLNAVLFRGKKIFFIENIIKKYILIKDTKHIIYRVHIFYTKNKIVKNGWYIRRVINIKNFIIRSTFKLHFLKAEFKVRYHGRKYIKRIFFKRNRHDNLSLPLIFFINNFEIYRNNYRALKAFY